MAGKRVIERWLAWVASCGWMMLGPGCGPAQAPSSGNPTGNVPDTFIFARGADAQKLDPADIDDGESVNTLAQVLEGLLRFKPGTFEIEGQLAESWEVSADGLNYTFRLRSGVRFHDGTPLTAQTALFSFARQMDPLHPAHFRDASFQYWNSFFADVVRIETPDDMTLRFVLRQPNAAQLAAFAAFPAWLISPTAFTRHGSGIVFQPVGTGPWRFVSWRPSEAVIFERNPDYWRSDDDGHGFERLVMRSIPLNTARLSELRAGRIHGLDGVQAGELQDLQGDPRFEIHHAPGLNVGYLAISTKTPYLQHPDVRRAIALAIDRQALVRLALDGYGVVAESPIPPGLPGAPDAGGWQRDLREAQRLLEPHALLRQRVITLSTFSQPRTYFPDPQRVASLIRSDLEAAGLRVEVLNRDFKSHLHVTRSGNFELALLGWIADTPDPDNFMRTFFHSSAAREGSATNISLYRDPQMDALLDAALLSNDPVVRRARYGEALALWWRDLPLIPLVHADQITVLRREIKGYTLDPNGNHYFGPVLWQAR
jgi:peptide/nickel transport system substrate-binding protein